MLHNVDILSLEVKNFSTSILQGKECPKDECSN